MKRNIIESAGLLHSPTTKGLAVFRSGVSVDDADQLLVELTTANDRIVLSDPVHVIFLLVRILLGCDRLLVRRFVLLYSPAVPRAAGENSSKTRLEALPRQVPLHPASHSPLH